MILFFQCNRNIFEQNFIFTFNPGFKMDLKFGFVLAWISLIVFAMGDSSPDSYQYINFGGKSLEIIGKSPLKKTSTKTAENQNTAKSTPVLRANTPEPPPAFKAVPVVNTLVFEQAQGRLDTVDRSARKSSSTYPRTPPATSSYGR